MVEEIPTASPSPSKNLVIIISILSIVSAILLFSAIYFFFANQSSQKLLEESETQNSQLEKDLIFYKNTDLAKEVEILNLKLKTAEEDLATTNVALDKLKADVSSIPKIARIASMMMATFGQQPPNCFSANDKTNINQELEAFGDREWISKWEDFINDTDAKNCSMSPDKLEQAVNYGLSKISGTTTK